jgi:Tfp pilus assembly PilM family ATPase
MPKLQLTKPTEELQARFLKRSPFPIKSRGPITALDWDGPLLRAAQSVERGSKAEIVRFAAGRVEGSLGLDQPEPNWQASGACLAQALQRLEVEPGTVVMGIPRGLVFLRTLSLPKPGTPAELAAMVYFQINKDLPFPPEEAVIDFQANDRLPSTAPPAPPGSPAQESAGEPPPATEKVDVLVAVVKKEVVQHYQRVAEAAGFKLAALGLDSYANVRGLQACEPARPPRTVALVTLRQAEVIIDVIAGGSLVFSRTAPLAPGGGAGAEVEPKPGPSSAEAEAGVIGTVAIETVRSLHNYEGLERHEPVEEILVAGAQGGEAAMVEALARRCHLPCRRLDPAGALGLSVKDSEHGSGALTALGLALSAQDQTPWPFDFLHSKRPPAPRNRRRAMLLRGAAAGATLLCVVWGIRAILIHHQVKIRNQLQAKINAAAGNRQVYRDLRLRAKTVQDWVTDKREWLDHYAYLSALLPDCTEVYVTSISAGTRGLLHVSVQARSGEILARIDKRLREAGYELKPLAITPCSDRYGYSFQSSLELTLPDKLKIDLAALKAPERPADDGSLEGPRPRPGAQSAATPGRDGASDSPRGGDRP